MNGPLELTDAAIETMLARRARRADAADLADIALAAIRRAPAPIRRPWEWLAAAPRLAPGSARWVWVAIAAMLALALVGGLLGVGARHHRQPYPLLTGNPALSWNALAVSGDELWTLDNGLWHYVGGAWHGPLSPPPLGGEAMTGLALGPDGAIWVAGESTVAVLRDGAWSLAWRDAPLYGLVAGGDGTVWVAQGRYLLGLRRDGAAYAPRWVECPTQISRIAATADGAVYVGGFTYAGGRGLARSDGTTCTLVDPVGDGQVHEVAELSAGPDGSLLATVFDEAVNRGANGGPNNVSGGPYDVSVLMLRDGRWSAISGPTVRDGVPLGLAIAPDGQPWRIDGDLGLERHDGAAWRVVGASARSLAMAPDGVLWYETDRGIERIRTDEVGG